MASAFSSSENAVLEREIEVDEVPLTFENIWGPPQQQSCVNWIKKNNFQKVCLQFPDNLLIFSTKICDNLKTECCGTKFYILADTSYGSCCVDEIAAAHVDADGIVHFGIACRTKASKLPVMNIFPRLDIDIGKFSDQLKEKFQTSNSKAIVIYFDSGYQYVIDDENSEEISKLRESLNNFTSVFLKKSTDECENENTPETVCIFVGQDNQAFFNKSMSVKATNWFIYDPFKNNLEETNPIKTNWIKRRYFYIEKCKDAQTLGLIVATLSSDGYLDVVKHIQQMARNCNIRTHIISVGRINPAKLANFMEIDCFVLIGCPFNNLYTSRDFYKPVISVFEAEMALNPAWHMKLPEIYATDFHDILLGGKLYREFCSNKAEEGNECGDVSLITGRLRNMNPDNKSIDENNDNSLVEKKNFQLMNINSGATFENRSWKGLEQDLGRTEPAKLQKGLSGIPIKYTQD